MRGVRSTGKMWHHRLTTTQEVGGGEKKNAGNKIYLCERRENWTIRHQELKGTRFQVKIISDKEWRVWIQGGVKLNVDKRISSSVLRVHHHVVIHPRRSGLWQRNGYSVYCFNTRHLVLADSIFLSRSTPPRSIVAPMAISTPCRGASSRWPWIPWAV